MTKLLKPKIIIIALAGTALLVVSVLGGGLGEAIGFGFLAGPIPFFSLAAETVFRIGPLAITNSMLLMWLTILFLVGLSLLIRRRITVVPGGLQNLMEMLIDAFGGVADSLGKGARRGLAIAVLIFIVVLFSNWLGLLPIVGSVGRVENVEEWLEHRVEEELHIIEEDPAFAHLSHDAQHQLATVEAIRLNTSQRFTVFSGDTLAVIPFGRGQQALVSLPDVLVYDDHALNDIEHDIIESGSLTTHSQEAWETLEKSIHDSKVTSSFTSSRGTEYNFIGQTAGILIPYLRGPSTDLNFTLAVALVAMISVQYFGVRVLGARVYMGKFFNLRRGPIWTFVGLLEVLSELSRIVSFTFRLFGNIFAGEILIFAIAFLLPLIGIVPFLGLELFVGVIQAFIFATLTLVFGYVATQAHGDEH